MVLRIRHDIAAFGPGASPALATDLDTVINETVICFVRGLTGDGLGLQRVRAVYTDLGARAAASGHGLDAIRAAGQIACQEAWQELDRIAHEFQLQSALVTSLFDSLIGFEWFVIDEARLARDRARAGDARTHTSGSVRVDRPDLDQSQPAIVSPRQYCRGVRETTSRNWQQA